MTFKMTALAAAAAAALLGTAALAASVDELVAQMEAEGYTDIEVETEDGITEIEGVLDGMEREIEIDADGNILSDEVGPADDEDEDDQDEDEDGDDEDDQDDAN